jgi:hypothetical protein
MIAYAFRRLRFEVVAVAVALAGVGMLALITGRAMQDQYESSGLASCLAGATGRNECSDLIGAFSDRFTSLRVLIVPLVLLPALFGAFVGGPLVARDVEAGTHRFFWTQSVTRGRWLASSTGAVLVAAVASGGVFSLITALWLNVTNRVTGERFGELYDMQGIVPIGATVMAAAIGVLAGAVIRRTVPAMAATIGGFIVIRLLLAIVVRPRLMPAKVIESAFGGEDSPEGTGAWILSETTIDATGKVLGTGGTLNVTPLIGRCPSLPTSGGGFPPRADVDACLLELGVRNVTRYQPGDRFWTFQILESLIMVGIGAAALGVAFWFVRRRIS